MQIIRHPFTIYLNLNHGLPFGPHAFMNLMSEPDKLGLSFGPQAFIYLMSAPRFRHIDRLMICFAKIG